MTAEKFRRLEEKQHPTLRRGWVKGTTPNRKDLQYLFKSHASGHPGPERKTIFLYQEVVNSTSMINGSGSSSNHLQMPSGPNVQLVSPNAPRIP